MRNRRSLGLLAAAFAWTADEPPTLARAGHARGREAAVAGWLARPLTLQSRLSPASVWLEAATRDDGTGLTGGGQFTDTLGPLRIERPDAACLACVRAVATSRERDVTGHNPVVYRNTPPAERAPPLTITD